MAKGVFYNVDASPKTGIKSEEIQEKLNLAVDWIFYDINHWIIYSMSDVEKWMTRLKPLIEPDGQLFICEINLTNHNGWMDQSFWDWIAKRV